MFNLFILFFLWHDPDFECCPLGTNPFHFQYTGFRAFNYMVTRHPQEISDNVWLRIFQPFDKLSWFFIGISLMSLSFGFYVSFVIYSNICPQRRSQKFDLEYIVLRCLFGFTEPDDLTIINARSGKIYSSISYQFLIKSEIDLDFIEFSILLTFCCWPNFHLVNHSISLTNFELRIYGIKRVNFWRIKILFSKI